MFYKRGRRRSLEVFLILILFAFFLLWPSAAEEVRLLNFVWMTTDDHLMSNFELVSSNMIFPLALKDFNERNGSVVPAIADLGTCNLTLSMLGGTMIDTHGLSNIAVGQLVEKYMTSKFDVVLGGSTADVARTLGVTAGALSLPVVSHIVKDDDMSNKQLYPSFFRLVSSNSLYASAFAKLLDSLGFVTVGLIYGTDVSLGSLRESLSRACADLGIQLVTRMYDSSASGPPLRASLQAALEGLAVEKINVILHVSLTLEYLWYMSEIARDLNYLKGKMHFISLSFFGNIGLDGAPNVTAVADFLSGAFEIVRDYEKDSASWRNLVSRWSTASFEFDINSSMPLGSSELITPDYLPNTKPRGTFNYRSWTTAYDAVMSIGLAACDTARTGVDLATALRRVRFKGASGMVSFDENQDRAAGSTAFFLDNLFVTLSPTVPNSGDSANNIGETTGTLVRKEVARLVGDSWIQASPMVFGGGLTDLPFDVTPPFHEQNFLPEIAQIFGRLEGALVVLLSLFIMWRLSSVFGISKRVSINEDETVCGAPSPETTPDQSSSSTYRQFYGKKLSFQCFSTKTTSSSETRRQSCTELDERKHPALMAWLLVGCTIMGFSIVSLTIEDSFGCMSFHWTFTLGFMTMLVAQAQRSLLLSEARAAYNQPRAQKYLHSTVIAFTLLPCIALLIAWQVTSPVEFVVVTSKRDEAGRPLSSSAVCMPPDVLSWVFFGVICGIYFAALIATIIISFKLHNAASQTAEARISLIANWCILQIAFVGAPAAAVVWGNALPRFLVLSSVVFLFCMIILFAIFVPQVLNWRLTLPLFSASHYTSRDGIGARSQADASRSSKGEGAEDARAVVAEGSREVSESDQSLAHAGAMDQQGSSDADPRRRSYPAMNRDNPNVSLEQPRSLPVPAWVVPSQLQVLCEVPSNIPRNTSQAFSQESDFAALGHVFEPEFYDASGNRIVDADLQLKPMYPFSQAEDRGRTHSSVIFDLLDNDEDFGSSQKLALD